MNNEQRVRKIQLITIVSGSVLVSPMAFKIRHGAASETVHLSKSLNYSIPGKS
jgi:hypothetical protein